MINQYTTITTEVQTEIQVKKSRFIATIIPVINEVEAKEFIAKASKKYNDARHNVPVYRILSDTGQIIENYSDNGEPKGTAGLPILDILRGRELLNVCVVVTRYFGGTLLGTGGLVRAYGDAVKEALNTCNYITKRLYNKYSIVCEYSDLEKLKYKLTQSNISFNNITYANNVSMDIFLKADELPSEILDKLREELGNISFELIENNLYI